MEQDFGEEREGWNTCVFIEQSFPDQIQEVH